MRPLKTLHIDSEMLWGGGQVQITGLCSYLRRQGHEVTLVCRPGSLLEGWARAEGFDVLAVEMRSTLSPLTVARLCRYMARTRPTIVHLHTSRAHVIGSAAARLARVGTVVATRHMLHPVRMTWPNTNAYGGWTDSIVAVSTAVRNVMIDCGIAPDKIRVIESGADIARFETAEPDSDLRRPLGVNESVPLIFAAATLTPCKGIRYLIEAVSLLRNDGLAVHLVIAGDGDQRAELELLGRELGVSVSFLGFQYDRMPALMATADVFAMPSISEGLGVAAIEAMAAAKPVVASSVGGLLGSVIDGVTGFSIPPSDSKALAEGIAKLISNPAMAAEFGATGRARARANYSLENMARANEALYYELTG